MGNKVLTNAELLAYYNNEYRKNMAGGGALPSFASVRDNLREEIYNNTRLNNRLAWEEQVVSEGNFQINEEKLIPEIPLRPGEPPRAPTF